MEDGGLGRFGEGKRRGFYIEEMVGWRETQRSEFSNSNLVFGNEELFEIQALGGGGSFDLI